MILLNLNMPRYQRTGSGSKSTARPETQNNSGHRAATSPGECDFKAWHQEEVNSYIVKSVEPDCL